MNVVLKTEEYTNDFGTFTRPKFEYIFMSMAFNLSLRSHCSRKQVGCVFVDTRKNAVISYGYNGNYAGGPNQCDSKESGNCGCGHAEVSSMSQAQLPLDNSTLYCTLGICLACAKLLINRKIAKVVYLEEYRIPDGLNLLRKNGIEVIAYNDL